MNQCTEQEVERLLRVVSADRRAEALRFKHVFGRYSCLRSWEMLDYMLRTMGYENMPKWTYNEYGKPYLQDGPYFSISHCKRAIAVAVSEREVGLDIESIRRADEALVRRTMNLSEQNDILRAENPSVEFTKLWTRKEAVLKMRGTGIIDDLHEVLRDETLKIETCTQEQKGYVYSVVERGK